MINYLKVNFKVRTSLAFITSLLQSINIDHLAKSFLLPLLKIKAEENQRNIQNEDFHKMLFLNCHLGVTYVHCKQQCGSQLKVSFHIFKNKKK